MDEAFVKRREEAGVKILAKGFDAKNDRVYVVQELDSMEVIQNAMAKNQEKIREAGVDMSTMQMIPLQDWSKKRFVWEVENKNEELGEKGARRVWKRLLSSTSSLRKVADTWNQELISTRTHTHTHAHARTGSI